MTTKTVEPIDRAGSFDLELTGRRTLVTAGTKGVGYSADIAGLEREFGRALTKLPDWARGQTRGALA